MAKSIKTPTNPASPNGPRSVSDGLLEALSGIGTDKDKLANTSFRLNILMPDQAVTAYRSDWIARKIVDIPPYDMTREWRTWQADEDEITRLEDYEETLGVQRKVKSALTKARLHGGSAIILGVNQGTNDQPINYEGLGKDALQFMHVVTRNELAEGPIEMDITSPWYGEPQFWTHTNANASMMKIHTSRVVPFIGMPTENVSSTSGGSIWGDSILQVVADAVKAAGLVLGAGAQLVAESKIDIIKIPGFSENIATKAYEDNLRKRFTIANFVKGVYSMLLIDREEEWQRQNASFSGLPDMLHLYLLAASGAADIPAVRFLGQSPTGLNSSGESDIRNYYDSIASKQKLDLSPSMARIDSVLIPSALGRTNADIFYVWSPLWQMSDKDKAEIAKSKADVMKADVDAQLIKPMVLKQARQNQLIEDGTYPGLEGFIEEFDSDNEDPDEMPDNTPPQLQQNANDPFGQTQEAGEQTLEEDEDEDEDERQARRQAQDSKRPKRGNRALSFFDTMKARVADASPRSLYVHRKVLNAEAIKAWARQQGFTSMLEDDDLHVTIIYSKTAVDWIKMGASYDEDASGNLVVRPGGPRCMEQFGKAQVLVFANSALAWRHEEMKMKGASSDYEDFNPHITISYNSQLTPEKLASVKPYRGEIVLGPEVFEEIKTGGFDEDAVEEQDL